MRTIHKFTLDIVKEMKDVYRIHLSTGSVFLCVMVQNNVPQIWIETDNDKPANQPVDFYIVGTGHPLPENINSNDYCGSFIILNDGFVGHVYFKEPFSQQKTRDEKGEQINESKTLVS